jgi:hypothetical protein
MPFLTKLVFYIVLSLFMASLYGCGERTVIGQQSGSKSEQSQACIDCHQSVVNQVTNKLIVEEWKLSHHNTSNGAGCADCHDPEPGHPTGCNLCHGGTPAGTTMHVSRNPDEDKKCNKCHSAAIGLFPTGSKRAHYGNTAYPVTFSSYTASYVSTNYVGQCRKCHNPHDPTSNIAYNRAWAQSGHGEVNVGPRTSRDFKLFGTTQPANLAYMNSSPSNTTDPVAIAAGTPVCVRCHTTTGFVNFVSSNFSNVKPFGSNTDKTKEVTGCDACHSDYSFKLRPVPRVTIYYNFSGATQVSVGNPGGHAKIQNNSTTNITFSDLGSSNVCVPCHSGRGIGQAIKLLDSMGVDFSRLNSPSSHDFGGAALLTAKIGYEFAGKEYVTGVGAVTGHDTVGLNSGKGPCITCHMNKTTKSDSHTFKPIVHGSTFPLYTTNRTWSQVFSVGSTSPATLTVASVTSQSCNTSGCHASLGASELTSDKEGYISALAVLNQWVRLVRNVPVGAPAAPVCVDTTNPPRLLTKWNYYGSGPDLMGSAFNLSTLNNEPGGYVHNPLYAKRLVYDSIGYLMQAESYTNVADAIQALIGNTRLYYTLKTGKTTGSTVCSDYSSTNVSIPAHQADVAIKWLYGKSWANLSASDKLKRPGDN